MTVAPVEQSNASPRSSQAWHSLSAEAALAELRADAQAGLIPAEAKARLDRDGRNELEPGRVRRWPQIIREQFKDVVVWVLLVAVVIALVLGETTDALVILTIVILNAAFGAIQESKAEHALAALHRTAAPRAHLVRGGEIIEVPSAEIVRGDVVLLEAGNSVPADLRLIEAVNLRVEEAALTGESEAVEKDALAVVDAAAGVGDRTNMAFATTIVTAGRGRGVVAETGTRTEVGGIARMLQSITDEQTPLQKRLEDLGKSLALLVLVVCGMVFGAGLLRGAPPLGMLLTSVSLAVAAIPEGLPAVVTVVLALGVRSMVRRHVIVRRLRAVEALGSTTLICTDKTGTLTQNVMTARRIWAGGQEATFTTEAPPAGDAFRRLLEIAALCNDAKLQPAPSGVGGVSAVGDPTETALLVAAERSGVSRAVLEEEMPRVSEIPFDSQRKRMTTVHKLPTGGYRVMVKGAPGEVLKLCSHLQHASAAALTDSDREELSQVNHRFAGEALRVLAFASRDRDEAPGTADPASLERDLVFAGYIGLIDPPRPEAKEAVAKCKQAGIRVAMITGDHALTAQAIGRELGLAEPEDEVMTGSQLQELSDEEFNGKAERVAIFARVSPADKLRIVSALQSRRQVVAMTGDGVNDAPALKKADIGVAMGVTGTDVARGAADIVLTDDNFASVVAAVEEGRGIFDNIRKFVVYLLSCNFSEVLTLFLAILIGLPQPLLAVQILWINLVTDGLPALALGTEPKEPDIMRRPPRDPSESVLTRETTLSILWHGAFITLASLSAYAYGLYWFCLVPSGHAGMDAISTALQSSFWSQVAPAEGLAKARTLTFGTLAFAQLAHSLNCRSDRFSILTLGLWSNPRLLGAIAFSAVAQLAVLHTQFGFRVFHTVNISGPDLLVAVVLSGSPLLFGELRKWIVRRASPTQVTATRED